MTIFQKALDFIKNLFNKIDDEAKVLVPIAINVVNGIKTVMDSPVDDVLVTLISMATKGTTTPAIVQKVNDTIKEWIPKVLTDLVLIDSIAHITDVNEQLNAILAQLKLSSDATKNIIYHGLSSLILEKLSDGKLSWSDSVSISQYYYTNFIKKSN